MNALASYSDALMKILYVFDEWHYTSVRVENPDGFTADLPPRFALIRRGVAWWLTDCSRPKSYVQGVR